MSVTQEEFETGIGLANTNLDQDVKSGAAPVLDMANFTGYPTHVMTFELPIKGVVDNIFNWIGEERVIDAGETGDYTSKFGAGNQHVAISVNSITTGGDLVITGTSISEASAVPNVGDTETITLDATTSEYQSDKKWLEVTEIDVETGTITGIDYDIEVLGYFDFGNRDWTIQGYRADMRTVNDSSDIAVVMTKIQDEGGKKHTHVTIENYGHDSTASNGNYFDDARTGAADRSVTLTSNLADSDTMVCYKQLDYSTHFTNDENVFEGDKAEGLLIRLEGRDSSGNVGGISNIDSIHLTIFYTY